MKTLVLFKKKLYLYINQKIKAQGMAKLTLKEYNQHEQWMFPPSIDSFVPQNSPARLVNEIVDKLDITGILATYKGGGTSAYHPRMMLKVIFFAYMNNTYSCRKIAAQLEQNVLYMWLSGNQRPDFRTINNFRSLHLKDTINDLFVRVVKMLCEMGYLSLRELYVDGTKIESRANKYTFVWKKTVEKNKARLEAKIRAILSQIDEGIAQDNQPDDDVAPAIDKAELRARIDQINKETLPQEQQKALKTVVDKMLPKLDEYDEKLAILSQRNSYAKTDPDATFMHMKEDAMNNGQTKPGYNLQIGTSQQFITSFALFPNPTDTLTLIPFLSQFQSDYDDVLREVTADSGYGSEENYMFLEKNGIIPYVKYNYFHKEQQRSYKDNPFLISNLYYNSAEDYFVCPMGQHMTHVEQRESVTEAGFVTLIDIYEANNCAGCPLRGQCHSAKGNRRISVNHNLNRLRDRAREHLTSSEGLKHQARRCIEPEAVFGQIKADKQYRRFRHVGKELVNMDFGIFAIAFNIGKLHKKCGGLPKEACAMGLRVPIGAELTSLEAFDSSVRQEYGCVRAKKGLVSRRYCVRVSQTPNASEFRAAA